MTLIPIPTIFPPIDDDKFYLVTMETFGGAGQPFSCQATKLQDTQCCKSGALINGWINDERDCTPSTGFCPVFELKAERLIKVEGPFDDGSCT